MRDRQGDRGKGNRNERKGRKKHLYSLERKEERVGEKEDGESQRLVYCVPVETKCLYSCISNGRKEGREGGREGGRGEEGRERREGRKVESKHSSLWQSRREEWKEDANELCHGTLTLAVCVVGRGSVGRAAVWSTQS